MPSEVEGGGVPTASKGSWSTFLKSIASFNGDLSSLTAPAFILSSQSLVEFSAYWAENQSLFLAPTQEPDPAKRALLVTKWLLNTLKQQYCSRSEKLGSEKKPLNPFLGELYLGHWEDAQHGRTELVSEQVSHHPPVTAYCITNEKYRIRLQGYNGQKASFSRTIHIKQIGHAVLTLYPPGSNESETYLITLPALHIENLIYGAPFVELGKYTHIVSSSGYITKFDFSGRGWLSGKKNSFSAVIWKEGSSTEKKPQFSLEGQWSDSFVMKEGEGKKAPEIGHFKPSDITLSHLIVAPIEEQDVFESRRAWGGVAKSVEKGDMEATSVYKSKIENAQRALRKKEADEGRVWKRVFFSQPTPDAPSEQVITKLVHIISGSSLGSSAWEGVQPEKTAGVWRFDDEMAKRASKPFHEEGLEALGDSPATVNTTSAAAVPAAQAPIH